MGELIVNAAKMALRISLMGTFMVAIIAIISLITQITFTGVFAEIVGIISMCLPFDLSVVMASIGVSVAAILGFLISNKIYHLSKWASQ